jgi:hypothetical protein
MGAMFPLLYRFRGVLYAAMNAPIHGIKVGTRYAFRREVAV